MRFRLLSLLLLLSIIVVAQPATDTRLKNLDSFANKVLKDWHAAGVAIAVVEKGKVIYTGGFGYRDYEKKLPVTDKTLFAIGSCTKAFTASLLGVLEKEGKLEIEKPVISYLPQLKFYNEYTAQHVTVQDMMCHRTGLPRHDFSWYAFPTTRDSLLQRIAFLEPSYELRLKYQYNNFMFLVQGALAEKLTGKTWEQNVQERFFNPLGMTASNFSVANMKKAADASKGYTEKKDSIVAMDYYNIDAMGPAGSINSNAAEMANWVITWIQNGKFNGKEIIPSGYVSQAKSAQMVAGSGLPDALSPDAHFASYGYGWALNSYRGHYRVSHGGNIDGFSASTTFFPTDSIGIVVLVNQNGSAVPGIIRNFIADKLLKLPAKDWNSMSRVQVFNQRMAAAKTKSSDSLLRKPGTQTSMPLKSYAGVYSHPGYGKLTIEYRNDSLLASSQILKLWLQHYHYDVFRPVAASASIDLPNNNTMRFQFLMNALGETDRLSIAGFEPSVKELVFTKEPTAIALTKEDLEKYAGEYSLSGAPVKIFIKEGKTLVAFLQGQPEYELVPQGNHTFNLKVLSGYSVQFKADDKGKITGLSFIQPNGVFTATKK